MGSSNLRSLVMLEHDVYNAALCALISLSSDINQVSNVTCNSENDNWKLHRIWFFHGRNKNLRNRFNFFYAYTVQSYILISLNICTWISSSKNFKSNKPLSEVSLDLTCILTWYFTSTLLLVPLQTITRFQFRWFTVHFLIF